MSGDTLVLLELMRSSYKHATGPPGAFRYQPYHLVFDCEGYLQVQELRVQDVLGTASRDQCQLGTARRVGGPGDCRGSLERTMSSGLVWSTARMTTGASWWWRAPATDRWR